jgi:hypothetical protein
VDPIKIRCTNSLTLQLRTCGRPIVSQPLGASIGIEHLVSGVHGLATTHDSSHQIIMWMRSQMSGMCVPPFCPYGLGNN